MLHALGDTLACPACRGWREGIFHQPALRVDAVLREDKGRVEQGFLRCEGCGLRYPILDGVAVIFRDVGAWLRQQERAAMWRDDLDPAMDRWLRGAWTEEEPPNWHRQMLAIYGRGLDTHHAASEAEICYAERRATLLAKAGTNPLVLDAGCGLGVATLSAAALGARVIAMDTDMGALRALSALLRHGHVELPRWRHGGADFDAVRVGLPGGVDPRQVLLVAADAASPPLRGQTMDLVMSYHLLDNVPSPVTLLRQLHAVLRPGGTLALASPYDWSPRCTPINERLGESVRASPDDPDPAAALRALLLGKLPALAPELQMQIRYERPALSWVLKRHERSSHQYLSHYVEAVRPENAG